MSEEDPVSDINLKVNVGESGKVGDSGFFKIASLNSGNYSNSYYWIWLSENNGLDCIAQEPF